jgi:hypothetical protein
LTVNVTDIVASKELKPLKPSAALMVMLGLVPSSALYAPAEIIVCPNIVILKQPINKRKFKYRNL